MIEKARKQHFRTADTVTFNSQFSTVRAAQTSSEDAQRAKPVLYHLPERAVVVWLTCQPADGLSDRAKLTRRIRGIEARAALFRRQEARRHRRPPSFMEQQEPDPSPDTTDRFPLVCKPTQCTFCLGNVRKLYLERIFEYATRNKIMNEVEKHLRTFLAQDPVPYPHP